MNSFVIAIIGPSASGKSTLAKGLMETFLDSVRVKGDNYWKDPERFREKLGFKIWEHPECIDFEKLVENVEGLMQGKSVLAPKWIGYKFPPDEQTLHSNRYIFVEGMMLLHDKNLAKLFDTVIYLDVPDEIYTKRKMERARSIMSASPTYNKEIVVPHWNKFGKPMMDKADLVIDGTLDPKEILEIAKEHIENLE